MPPTSNAYPGPETVRRTVLDNGLTILVRENHATPVVVLEGLVAAGAAYDPPEKLGLAEFVAVMSTHGSAHYDFDRFNEVTESVGAGIGLSADSDLTAFSLSCLAEDFADLVDVLADALLRPAFPSDQIEIVRGQSVIYHQERLHDTQQMAGLRFYETLYQRHPYGHAVTGYPETVMAIRRDDLVRFHAEHYVPTGAVIVVSGDVKTEATLALLASAFGDWRGGARADTARGQELPAVPSLKAGSRVEIDMPDKVQSDIVIGCQAVPRSHPDFYAIRVANTILGRFGMMGRLGESLREDQGLAYTCSSSQDAESAGGAWYAMAGVHPDDVEPTIEAIQHEFDRLGSELVPLDELRDSQAYMTGIVPLALETNAGVASTLVNMEWYGLGLDYLQRYNELIYGVTPEDVLRVARQYLQLDKSVLVVAGPTTA